MATTMRAKISFEEIAQKDLTVVRRIQRQPKAARVKKLSSNWDPAKEGVLFVAKLTDGPHKGVLHIYDGGTRWEAKADEPDYVFRCLVSPMTEKQAAQAYLAFNNESKRPSAYENYVVGIEAEWPYCLAMQIAFDDLELIAVERSSTRNQIAAIAASRNIVLAAHRVSGDWEMASDRLRDVLVLCRELYDDHTAHDADLIQTVANLWALNPGKLDGPARNRFIERTGDRRVSRWRMAASDLTASTGGSESRAITMARMLAQHHNKGLRSDTSVMWLNGPKQS